MTKRIREERKAWEERKAAAEKKRPPRDSRFTTWSDMDVPEFCGPDDLEDEKFDYLRDLGFPGEYPFTRGVQRNMYRGRVWTMRQFAGFSTAKDTNARFKLLLEQGQTGLSTAFDLPTLMGRDPDHPLSKGEVGKCGVSVCSIEDMEELYAGIPLGEVTTSMTINAPAVVLLALYFTVAERQGVPKEKVGGTIQNDILKEYIAQKEWVIPIRPAVDLVTDSIEYCTRNYPAWNTISISGYHIREAGATAVQELAFTMADGLAYCDEAIRRGLSIDEFAPRLSYFWDVHNDFFEEIAKFRAGRRMWARFMREKYKAQNPRSWMLRTHAQTAGVSLTAQQPMNNVVRVAIQGLAAVLGGTQSLHTNSMDETLALPTDESVMVALRTQQILAEETGVTHVTDPLGGSYFVEKMTNKVEAEALAYIEKINEMGGMVTAVEKGFPQAEIANASYHFQQLFEKKEKVMVGVNKYQVQEKKRTIETLYIDESVERDQIQKLQALRKKRNSTEFEAAIQGVKDSAQNGKNMMEPIIRAVKASATVGEVCDALRAVHGEYRETGVVY